MMSNMLNSLYQIGGEKMQNRLKFFREEKKLSQSQLSEKSGVSRVTINQLENGKLSVCKTDTLTKIADALCKTVSEVFFCE